MYMRIALTTLLLWCAGCTLESTPTSATSKTDSSLATGVASATGITPLVRNRSFANLPDHGDLVAYPAQRVIRRDGAYTWHRAGLSEEHALQAVGGVMQITTPAGKQLRFQYERHVEHPSGDWTWIGRAKGGAASDEVILTFGEHAVFGSISQPGQAPLKLTMGGGVSWVIETDRSQIAGIDNPATRPRKPDFLIPPKVSAGFGASSESSTATAPSTTTASAQAAVTTTVDVLLGYTSGFAAAQGGQSQAVTRLNNMVEIANLAYANSQVEARVRLVHAMQVSYPDNTSNDSALEALTGFRAPNTPTTPDPAFAALRSARDQYGADLVSLVRRFYSPENDGCGIAWLIGGGQSGIDSRDEFFGYSVVSDGRDVGTDGKTYYCREETLAHELGHNMGTQHDSATATVDGSLKYGVYPYSFGLKTGATTGDFYTVMAYGDKGQASYRVFSNPRINYCSPTGGPIYSCGITNEADNARSLVQTMPLVAGFRATVVPPDPGPAPGRVRNDVNGDGRSDIIWHSDSLGKLVYWRMSGAVREGYASKSLASGYRVIATGDFNGDGRSDLLWENTAQTGVWMWLAKSTGDFTTVYLTDYPSGYRLAGAEDINGDGRSDILWHSDSLGKLVYWRMNGSVREGYTSVNLSKGYKVVGTGDFNGDGRGDLLWENSARTGVWMWLAESTGGFSAVYLTDYPTGYRLAGVEDINGDGRSDILWRSDSLGKVAYWRMNGAVREGYAIMTQSAGYRIVTTGDFNGDGRGDLLWEDAAKTGVWMWLAKSTGDFTVIYVTNYPSAYRLVPWAAP